MALPTVQTLQRLAAETGYRLDTLEKVLRLLELLDEIAQDPVLSQRLALKGRARVPLRVVGERAELSRRGSRPWRSERGATRRRARSRGAHRGHADACLEMQARSQPSGPQAVRED